MKKAAIVLAATMVFSLFSEAGMAAPQTVQAALGHQFQCVHGFYPP